MAESAKRMGRPPGEPSKVVRLPLPVAALQSAWRRKACGQGISTPSSISRPGGPLRCR